MDNAEEKNKETIPNGMKEAVAAETASGSTSRQKGDGWNETLQGKDVQSKTVFDNPELCAQFLRDYSELPMLRNVQPEDIEDVSERYHLFKEVEYNSDTVKKIRIKGGENGEGYGLPVYLISLIEHKSSVYYNIHMQILKYMVCIWENWEKEMETLYRMQKHTDRPEADEAETGSGSGEASAGKGSVSGEASAGRGSTSGGESAETIRNGGRILMSSHKDFKYPPIYPIVYYEGSGKWTAPARFSQRVMMSDVFRDFIPDFTYHLIGTHAIPKDRLISNDDAISFIMMLNKIQGASDFGELRADAAGMMNRILQTSSPEVLDIVIDMLYSFCRKMNLPDNETGRIISEVRGGNMGYFWENMEKMDIQQERRNTAEQKERADEAEQRADEAEQRADEAEQRADEAEQRADKAEQRVGDAEQRADKLLHNMIQMCKDQGKSREEIIDYLVGQCGQDQAQVEKILDVS